MEKSVSSADNLPRLSIIIVVYNMQRAAPRSIKSLLTPYQRKINDNTYEIIVVENGSSEPLDEQALCALGGNIRYFNLQNPPPSPAYAINFAADKAKGDVFCIMVDGAHMLTPGALHYGMELFSALPNPIVCAPQFFLGPGPQMETIFQGYDESAEDQ